jgi:hypothetical protein
MQAFTLAKANTRGCYFGVDPAKFPDAEHHDHGF